MSVAANVDPVAIVALVVAALSLGWQIYTRWLEPTHASRVAKRLRRDERQEEAIRAISRPTDQLVQLCELFEEMRGFRNAEEAQQPILARIQGTLRGVDTIWAQQGADIYDEGAIEAFNSGDLDLIEQVRQARTPLEASDGVGILLDWVRQLSRHLKRLS